VSPSASEAPGGGPSSGTATPPSSGGTPSGQGVAPSPPPDSALLALLAPFLPARGGGDAMPYDDVAALDALVTAEAGHLAALTSAHLKLPAARPADLPDDFAQQLQAAWLRGLVAGGGIRALEAAVRPGCVVLHVDALVAAPPGAPAASRPASAGVAARALAADAAAGAFFEEGAAGAGATFAAAGCVAPVAASGRERRAKAAPRLPPLRPAAVLAGGRKGSAALGFAAPPQGLPAAAVLRARLAGRMLSAPGGEASSADRSALPVGGIALPPLPSGTEGALLVDAFASPDADFPLAAAPRAMLLCAEAAVVAEVNAAAEAADAAAAADRGAAADALEALLPALGRSLRPGADVARLQSVATEAMRRRWAATSARVLAALATAFAEEGAALGDAPPAPPAGTATLLHAAALHGSAVEIAAVLRCGAAAGAADAAGPRGITPLHVAASRHDTRGAAALAALRSAPGGATAWSSARDAWGLTPADVASRPAEPSEADYIAWLAVANRSSVIAIAALQLCHFPTWLGMRYVLSPATAAGSAAEALRRMHFLPRMLVQSSTLYDVATGAVVPLAEVPWPAVVAATSLMVRYSLAIRLPANAVLLLASALASPALPRARRWFTRHFEWLYALCNVLEMLHMPLVEYLACYRALGLAVDYSPIFAFSYFLATQLLSPGFGRSGTFGPCRAACNYAVLTLRLTLFAGTLTWQRTTWRAAATSPQLIAQMLMCLLSLANVAHNDRRLRRLCASEKATAEAAAAKRVD